MNQLPFRNNRKEKLEHAENLLELGSKAFEQNNPREALLFYQESFLIRAATLGIEHPDTGAVAGQLGQALQNSRCQAEAADFFTRSLEYVQNPQEPDFYYLGSLLERLGNHFFGLNDLSGARIWYELAQAVFEKARGPEDRQTVFILQKRVGLAYSQGNLTEARRLMESVLAADEKVYGPQHPKVASDLSSLGKILNDLDDLEGARSCFERAITIEEQTLNWDNARLAADLTNLGTVLEKLGQLQEARTSFERVLAIDSHTFGPSHPKTAPDIRQIGDVLRKLGDQAAAQDHYRRALAIYQEALPESHPTIQELEAEIQKLG